MGMFIVVEGVDGSGKSTLAGLLAEKLAADSIRFPERSSFYGAYIDDWLKGQWKALEVGPRPYPRHFGLLDAAVFQALQVMNRIEFVPRIEHALEAPGAFVCDRYWPSGYAYGYADGLDPKMLVGLHAVLPQPDLSILVDCDPEIASARVRARGASKAEVYEKRGPDYYAKVRKGYGDLWGSRMLSEPGRWVRVTSNGSKEETLDQALQAIRLLRPWLLGAKPSEAARR
jgi:dTMP kinase